MKPVKILFPILLTLMCSYASAQFTIRDVREFEMPELERKEEPIIVKPEYKFEYINEAQRKVIRRQKRKDRNYLEFKAKMNLSQASYGNWSSNDDNNLNVNAEIYFKHQFKINRFDFTTAVTAKYGLNYVDKEKFKNLDEFKLELNTNWSIHKNWSYSASGVLRSQFSPGYKNRDDKIKRNDFMSPGYLDLKAGVTYKLGPFSALFSPIGGNARFVLNDEMSDKGWHGVEKGKRVKWSAGPSLTLKFNKNFFKNILGVKSDFYSYSDMHSNPNFWWETRVAINAVKFLETSLNFRMQYDELSKAEKAKSMQYRTLISFGLSYTIKNK